MILNCFRSQIIAAGAVFTALFLFLCPYSFAVTGELPSDKEELPKGYVKDAPTAAKDKAGDRFFFHFDADLYYTYSDASNSDALSGLSASILAAPTYKIDKGTFLSLIYDGAYSKKREFYTDGTGYRARAENQSHTVTPVFRYDFGQNDRFTIKPSLFFTQTYNKDTNESDWDDGLYNYRDYGGGVDFTARELITGQADDALTLGFQLYKRKYPNYVSLLDLSGAGGLNSERDEKDYLGLILNTRYQRTQELGMSWSLGYSLLTKWLDDKKVVDMNGVLTSEEQKDYLHMLEAKTWYLFEGGFRLGLNLEADKNDSNQNYYEGFNTIGLGDDIATRDYYDYVMYQINPNISYQFRLIPLTLFASYSYQKLEYDDRLAENSNGTYKTEKQEEETITTALGAKYAFNENWALVCQWEHTDVDSNNLNESVYQYNYWADTYTIGISVKF
jgi:hypothetical protein